MVKLATDAELKDAAEVRQLLSAVIHEVMDADRNDLNTATTKARTVAYVAGVLLRAYEISDLEARVAALEKDRA